MSEEDYDEGESEFNESDLDDVPLMLDYPHQYEDEDDVASEEEDRDIMPLPAATKPPSFSLGLALNRVQPIEEDSQPPMTRRGGPDASIRPLSIPMLPQPFSVPSLAMKQLTLIKEAELNREDQPTTRHRKGEEERAASSDQPPSLSLFTSLRQPLPLNDIISRTLGPSSIPESQDRVLVSLLSPAMALPLPPNPSSSSSSSKTATSSSVRTDEASSSSGAVSEAILSKMATALHLPKTSLRCFALSEVPWSQLDLPSSSSSTDPPPSLTLPQAQEASGRTTKHVAVLVESSSFSLPALEDLLKQNKQLLSTQAENAKTIGSLQSDYKQATISSEANAVKVVAMEKDLEHLRSAVARLEAEKEELKVQLRRCDEQRLQLKGTLTEIRREFAHQSQTM